MKSVSEKLTRTQQARRHDIINAAISIINREGYAAASIQKIANEAHASKSTVLYHFKSKAAIDQAIIGSVFEEGAAYMTPFIVQAQTYREKLAAYLSSNLQYIADNAANITALHEIDHNLPKAQFTQSSQYLQDDAPIQWLGNMLHEGQKSGEFGDFDPSTIATSIRLVIDGSSHYILTHPSLDIKRYIAEIVQLFDRATTMREPTSSIDDSYG